VRVRDLNRDLDLEAIGEALYQFVVAAYPICRSITGDGFRQTLEIIRQHIPLTVHEVPTGTRVLDWTVPKEWNIRDAYVTDMAGRRVIDFRASNLHVVSYSIPLRTSLTLADLRAHLFTLPSQPDLTPYRTSYYSDGWGFCLSENQLQALGEGSYQVCIDSSLEDGHLTYGEYFLKGEREDEVLISCHCCHPSLCNDNLSGMALTILLAEHLTPLRLQYSYRFLFIPGTIGSITWLALNEERLGRIKHGLVLTGVGDSGRVNYKKTRRGDAEIDLAAAYVLHHSGDDHSILEFSPYGYDERQYCSPGFNLPVGCLMRTPYGEYPEYHTSADNLEFVQPEYLADSFSKCLGILRVLEDNRTYLNLSPKGEPQLGKRGLYGAIGGQSDAHRKQLALLWVLSFSDGAHSVLDIASRSGMPFDLIVEAAAALAQAGLLQEVVG
jgi:aminopeptidase-like protein